MWLLNFTTAITLFLLAMTLGYSFLRIRRLERRLIEEVGSAKSFISKGLDEQNGLMREKHENIDSKIEEKGAVSVRMTTSLTAAHLRDRQQIYGQLRSLRRRLANAERRRNLFLTEKEVANNEA